MRRDYRTLILHTTKNKYIIPLRQDDSHGKLRLPHWKGAAHTVSPLGKKLRAKVRGDGRRHAAIVADVVRILDAGRSSKFEYEAATRVGLRAGFCLEGRTWKFADTYAAAIVKEALHRIGAARPTWEQGQPEWAQDGFAPVQRFFCSGCARPIPKDRTSRIGLPVKYCSDLCMGAAYARKARRSGERMKSRQWIARCAARTRHTKEQMMVPCMHCGTDFVAKYHGQKFCSRRCAFGDQIMHRELPCAVCGNTFKPRGKVSKYCSKACRGRALTKERAERQCPQCGTVFRPTKPSDKKRYCSPACASAASIVHRQQPCAMCGKPYLPKNSGRGPTKCCSRACAARRPRRESDPFACEAVAAE